MAFHFKKMSRVLLATAVVGAGFSGLSTGAISSAYAEAVSLEAPSIPGFADVVDAVSPAVVSVRVESDIRPIADDSGRFQFNPRGGDLEDQMRRFFGQRDRDERSQRRGNRDRNERLERARPVSQGSGFFISEDGLLVTNNHVIARGTEFTVVMNDGTELDAELIGKDERTDLAVLKVTEEREFTYVDFADENDVRIGDWVVAVGNPFGLGGTVTAGILSARGRDIGAGPYDDFLQIDAAVNRGNSGGPTFSLNGKVVGINTAIYSPSGGNVGIAFAVPATLAQEVIADLIDGGTVERGWLGVSIQPVTDEIAESLGMAEAKGALVADPQDGSPAAKAGIEAGDIILKVDDIDIESPRDLSRLIASIDPGSTIAVSVMRGDAAEVIDVELGKLAQTQVASAEEPSVDPEPAALEEFGLTIIPSEDNAGALVTSVEPGSQASETGIRAGDIISEINGQRVASAADVRSQLDQVKANGRNAALLRLETDDQSRFVALPLG